MKLIDIDFSKLTKLNIPLRWNVNENTLRTYYTDGDLFYKIWPSTYNIHKLVIINDTYQKYEFKNNKYIASIDCGIINELTCPAFVDFIVDEDGNCVGYITKKGVQLSSNDEIDKKFIELFFEVCISNGYLFSDFVYYNIIKHDGRLSIIDLDSPPVDINTFNVYFQRRKGCLRPHVHYKYRLLILNFIRQRRI